MNKGVYMLSWKNGELIRSVIYSVLSNGFNYPSKELVEEMQNGNFLEILSHATFKLSINDIEIKHSLETINNYIETWNGMNYENLLKELQVEYTRIFIGPMYVPCPPYESVYREGLVMQKSTIEVIETYAEAGLEISTNYKDNPDHIGAELEFMHYLCKNSEEAINEDNIEKMLKFLTIQERFIRDHILIWINKFCDDIIHTTTVDFYKGLAMVTKVYLKLELERVENLISEVKKPRN